MFDFVEDTNLNFVHPCSHISISFSSQGPPTREIRPPRVDTKGELGVNSELIFKLPGNTRPSPNCQELKHKHLGIKTGDRAETPGKMIFLPLIS